jgi:predicted PurR-regulated permease PerM
MNRDRFQLIFFSIFIAAVLAINFFIFLPYLSVLFLALVFAILFNPLYEWVLKKFFGKESLASLITVFLVFLIIVGPLSFLGKLLFNEASSLYDNVASIGVHGFSSGPLRAFAHGLTNYFPNLNTSSLEISAQDYLAKGLQWFLNNAALLFSGVLRIGFDLFLILLSLFFFFRDGKRFASFLVQVSPLNNASDRKILEHVAIAVKSVVGGHVVVSLVEGFLLGLGFALFGAPSPVILGTMAAVASFIPLIGPSIIFVPVAVFVFFSSGLYMALGLALWGFLVAGFMGSIVGPSLMNRNIHIHPLLILISVLGGLAYFGLIGFLAGPVLLSLLFALFDVYPAIVGGKIIKMENGMKSHRLF